MVAWDTTGSITLTPSIGLQYPGLRALVTDGLYLYPERPTSAYFWVPAGAGWGTLGAICAPSGVIYAKVGHQNGVKTGSIMIEPVLGPHWH